MTVTPTSYSKIVESEGFVCDKCEEKLTSGDTIIQLVTYIYEEDGQSFGRDKVEGYHPVVHKGCLEDSDTPEPLSEQEVLDF